MHMDYVESTVMLELLFPQAAACINIQTLKPRLVWSQTVLMQSVLENQFSNKTKLFAKPRSFFHINTGNTLQKHRK